MKKVKANLEICKHIAEGKIVHGQVVNEDLTFVFTIPGYYGYIFANEDIAFAIEKIKMIPTEIKTFVDLSIIKPKNEIKSTRDFRLLDKEKWSARKFVTQDGKEVWINNKFLCNIIVQECSFYQDGKNPVGSIIAVEKDVPVMVLLPIRQYNL